MTAHSAIARGLARKHANKKDGPPMHRRPKRPDFEQYGFTFVKPPATWTYTWPGNFPSFSLAPGTQNGRQGLIARCAEPEEVIYFPYSTPPAEIKAVLDDAILEMMRHQAELAEGEMSFEGWRSDIADKHHPYEEVDF